MVAYLREKNYMKDNCFFDTNILIYSKFPQDLQKQGIAQNLITSRLKSDNVYISTQVMSEFINCSIKKAHKTMAETKPIVNILRKWFDIIAVTPVIVLDAMEIAEKYGFSFYDSLIVSAALYANCTILYTEDLQDGQVIEDVLAIKNPFKQI